MLMFYQKLLMRLDAVKMIIGQDAYSLRTPVEYKSGEPSQPCAVRTDLGWTTSGPLPKSVTERLICTTQIYYNTLSTVTN